MCNMNHGMQINLIEVGKAEGKRCGVFNGGNASVGGNKESDSFKTLKEYLLYWFAILLFSKLQAIT